MRRLLLSVTLALAAMGAGDLPVVEPQQVAGALARGSKPAVLYVGPNVLYRSKHIPGAIYAGPAGKAEGLDLLKKTVAGYASDREIVLYCGCCPWDRCPNVRPAVELLRKTGFTRVKVMYLPNDFKADWIDKGYPVE
jgi:thiosulfate/3-mercaptopyruvate sulfurtransferase